MLMSGKDWDEIMIMFQDEARFGRINSPHKCWVQGERPVVYSQMIREYTYAYTAVCPFDGTMDSLIIPLVSTEGMNIFLEEVGRRHRDKTIIMFLDQAGWHKSKTLKIPKNIMLLPLPSYSPELNPVEHIWDEIREKWFHNIAFDSNEAVVDQLAKGLTALENDTEAVASITGFDWIVSII